MADNSHGMIGALSSFSSTPFSFPRKESIKTDHDHIPEGCSFCQPKSDKATTATQKTDTAKSTATHNAAVSELTPEEKKQVEALKKRDQEVRLHEQAHLATAGAHARGGPSFSYQQGPDGKQYAVGGEVPIDLSPIAGNPQATIQKAETLQRAALAPADPSGTDRRVAAQAAALAIKARQEIAQQSQETTNGERKFAAPSSLSLSDGTYFPSRQISESQDSTSLSPSSEDKNLSKKQRDSIIQPGTLLNIFV